MSQTKRTFWDRFFFDWHAGEALGAARLYFGFGLAIYVVTQYMQLLLINPAGPHFLFTLPIWYFELLGIEHNIPWLNAPALLLLVLACGFFALGRHTKTAIIAILVLMFYLKGVRDSFSGDVHHREVPIVAILVLFFVSKCDEVFGIDARRKGLAPIADWEGSWPLRAMQVYIALFYFWALVAKLRVSGLYWFENGGHIQDMLLARSLRDGLGPDGTPVNLSLAYDLAQHPIRTFWIGAGVFAFELFFPLILFVRHWKLKLFMLLGATSFHLSNYFLMNVQFFFYPFVFVTFFDLRPLHAWLRRTLRLSQTVPA